VTQLSIWFQKLFVVAHRWAYERSGGRVGAKLGSRPMLLLHTIGRKSGERRTSALLYAEDGANFIVVASRYGGPVNPAWYHNLLAQPDVEIQVGRRRLPVRAHLATGAEREQAWAKADQVNKGQYTVYQARTDREIPVVVLEPR
jgi:deazaflavin-dependent oxidoreductase (nitroreductase family)